MKRLIVSALFAASVLVGPGAIYGATSASAQTPCGPGAPAEWQRPGGFCDQTSGTRSLTLPGTDTCTDFEYVYLPVGLKLQRTGARVRVAVTCTINCYELVGELNAVKDLEIGERIRVAQPSGCTD